MEFNQREIDRIKWRCKQTVRILDLVISGDTNAEITRKTGAQYGLVQHYRKAITIKE